MKKRIKTTDSVLRDIFDSIEDADKSLHPLSSMEAPAENRIEALVLPPSADSDGAFKHALEEIQKESLLFKDEPAPAEAEVEVEAVAPVAESPETRESAQPSETVLETPALAEVTEPAPPVSEIHNSPR